MATLNQLKAVVQSIRISTEEQAYRAAATIDLPSVLFSKSRRITYITTLYDNGNYEAAKEKLNELKANTAITDVNLNIKDPEKESYGVTATEKIKEAWSTWSQT